MSVIIQFFIGLIFFLAGGLMYRQAVMMEHLFCKQMEEARQANEKANVARETMQDLSTIGQRFRGIALAVVGALIMLHAIAIIALPLLG